ncbi:MAG TPA: hypothetical protein VK590_16255 [Saprospiraceae bacterium]|nr:hypothetical protein [Saprospiraceae bacterium]
MKGLISISLIILISYPQLTKIGAILNWKINQDYIAKNICINRFKPMLHCDGKCQLSKMIQRADEENRKAAQFPLEKLKNLSFDFFSVSFKYAAGKAFEMLSSDKNSLNYQKSCYSYKFINSCFHPPQRLV